LSQLNLQYYTRVSLAKIDSEFDDFIFTNSYGVTSEIFKETKKHLSYSFFDIEETIDYADKISKITNPWEFVVETQSKIAQEYPFHRPYSYASKFMDNIAYMEEGLNELKIFKAFLKSKNKLEDVKELAKSITILLPEIENLIENSSEDKIIINYAVDKEENKVKIEYNANNVISFSNSFKRIDEKGFERNKDGTLKPSKVIEFALSKFREYIESELEYDEDNWLKEYEE
jgi:hypothetical protein